MEKISKNLSIKLILVIMTIGVWAVALQNAGIIPTKQNVYVKGGYVDIDNTVDVSGSVDIDNTVDISGSVDIDNTVAINIDEVNGSSASTYGDGLLGVYDPY